MIIDDRTFIVNPAVEGSLIYIIAKKWGKMEIKRKVLPGRLQVGAIQLNLWKDYSR